MIMEEPTQDEQRPDLVALRTLLATRNAVSKIENAARMQVPRVFVSKTEVMK